jgi:hypothetical protein
MMRFIAASLMVFLSPIGLRLYAACSCPAENGIVTNIIGRLAWAIPMAGLAALTMHDIRGLLIAPFLFGALSLPHFDSSDMGRVNGTLYGDAGIMLLRGFAMAFAAAFPLLMSGGITLRMSLAIMGIGIFAPLLYELGWRTERKLHVLLDEHIEFAEAYWGAFYGLALGAVLLAV